MNFTKATYRKARSRAINDLYSRADILEWVKNNQGCCAADEARTEYFKALETANRIVARGRREKGLWR